ncbi:MalY/PatB family protein [Jonesia quinghaiensis]|uniref:MalY/PatB family protein n=1 Tax=Jonesia quinghaiensis TaxID=262806 RepID=UPI0003F723E4|nr:aminotransferase class I/II-fold pyridoxal phosphate-dependent enzyme [Jonesia quinghaiensis]
MAAHNDTQPYDPTQRTATGNPLEILTLDDLRARHSSKWTRYPSDVLPLWVAEMDAVIAPEVVSAVTESLQAGDVGYPGREQFYQAAFASFALDTWGWRIPRTAMTLVPDVMHGIIEVLRAANTRHVVINTPVYPPFQGYPESMGITVTASPLTPHGRIDLDALDRDFTHADTYLLCNPHNPTGVAHTREELTKILELAHKHNITVIADEIHGPLTSPRADAQHGGPAFTPILSIDSPARVITVTSAAKGWHLAGFKAGLAIHNPPAADIIARIPGHVPDSVGKISIIAHSAALRDARDWLETIRHHIDDARTHFEALLAEHIPAARIYPADATYLAWVDMRDVRTASGTPLGDDPAQFILEHALVAVNPGHTFGEGGQGHARFNLATRRDILTEAVQRIATALAEH